jgi:hypothetical protein
MTIATSAPTLPLIETREAIVAVCPNNGDKVTFNGVDTFHVWSVQPGGVHRNFAKFTDSSILTAEDATRAAEAWLENN